MVLCHVIVGEKSKQYLLKGGPTECTCFQKGGKGHLIFILRDFLVLRGNLDSGTGL